jgi:general secretion pathway protein D
MIFPPPRLPALLLAFLLPWAGLVAQTPPSPSVPVADDAPVGPIRLPDAPLDAVIQLLEMWTGRTALRAQNVPATSFSLIINDPIPKSQALLALETLMQMNGVGISPLGDRFIKVVPLANVRIEAPEFIDGSTLGLAPSGRVASKVFTLQFLRVTEFLPQITPLLNPQLGGPVAFDKTNAALITDSITTLQRVEALIARLDQPVIAGLEPRFYPLRHSKASDLVTKLRTILQGAVQQQLGTATTYNADDRTNQVVLIADPRLHPFFDDLIYRLDVQADPNTRHEVIRLNNAPATDVATLLSQLISGQNQATARAGATGPATPARPAQAGQPGAPTPPPAAQVAATLGVTGNEFSSFITVLPDERSNAVVVSGTVDDIRLIRQLVSQLDVLLAQVRIEVVIAEVTLNDTDASGIESLGLRIEGDRLVGFAGSGPGFSVTDGSINYVNPVSGLRDLAATLTLSASRSRTHLNVLSQPNIVTTHNQEASIFVGEERPVISGYLNETTGTGVSAGFRTNVSPRDIGINLTVKPLIGDDGSVQLEIKQKVEDVLGTILVDGNEQPRIGRRETESFVSVRSGEIIVLGGLQRTLTDNTRNRLGPIPILGDLLGQRRRETARTDLIFFLRPVVLTNSPADNTGALSRLDSMAIGEDVKRALAPRE